jgi:hypothetical protein
MERLWSQAGATGGNRSQMGLARKRLKRADQQPVATHGNRFGAHGKEGVDGSSPSEGLQNPRSPGFFVQDDLLLLARTVGMELFMELCRTVSCGGRLIFSFNRRAAFAAAAWPAHILAAGPGLIVGCVNKAAGAC